MVPPAGQTPVEDEDEDEDIEVVVVQAVEMAPA